MERITKALSVRQPWAHAIIHEGKTIENRSWQTKLRGTVAIHAGRLADDEGFFAFVGSGQLRDTVHLRREEVGQLPRGAVVGVVDLVDCVRESPSPWFEGPFGFVLANPRPLKPIVCAGAMQFFELPPQVIENIAEQLSG
ncbi:MAG: hypothetical protein QOG72_3359 [Sphingomonadales bacterium]|jgi:hypothetical protein|nr:hypothetical protein [Sphingomonadales bacterium]